MASEFIPKSIRIFVESRAQGYCEYCYSPEIVATDRFAIEHILPRVSGGQSNIENLAWSCLGCNSYKHVKTHAIDPQTGDMASLFHPRQHRWSDHFVWGETITQLVGITPIGRATVKALQLNRIGVVNLRSLLCVVGKHPPMS